MVTLMLPTLIAVLFIILAVFLITDAAHDIKKANSPEMEILVKDPSLPEKDRLELKCGLKSLKESAVHVIVFQSFLLVLWLVLLVMYLLDFRDNSINAYRQGKIYTSSTQYRYKTDVKGDTLKIDTLYNYKVAKKDKPVEEQ